MDDDTRAFDENEPTQYMRPDDDDGEETTRVMPGGADEFPTRRFDPATPMAAESHTEILDIPPDPRASRATGLAVAIVVLAFIASALLGYTTRVPHPSGQVGRALVGPDGGAITFDDSGRLEIQKGALSTATTITIRKVKLNQNVDLRDQSGNVKKSFPSGSVNMYTFEPNNTTFNQPVTIRLPMQGDADGALVVVGGDVKLISGTKQGNVFVIQTNNFEFR